MDKSIWNSLAQGYAEKHGFGKGLMKAENEILGKIFKEHKTKSIVDVACGPGRHVRSFKSAGFKAVGTDFSIGMLKEAKKLGNDIYILADSCHLPFSDNSFDCVTCLGNSIGSLDTKKSVEEMVRVAKNIVIIDFRKEIGKSGILNRRFDKGEFPIRVWNEREVSKILSNLKLDFRIIKGQVVERGYFFYAVISK